MFPQLTLLTSLEITPCNKVQVLAAFVQVTRWVWHTVQRKHAVGAAEETVSFGLTALRCCVLPWHTSLLQSGIILPSGFVNL